MAGTKGMMCQAGFGSLDVETRQLHVLLRHVRRRLRRRARRATAPTRCRRTGRTPRTRRSRRPSSTTRCGSRGSRWSRTPRAPGRFRGGLGLRKDYLFDRPTTYTILADRDRFGPWGAFGGHDAGVAEYVLIRGGSETRLGSKVTVELEAGRRDQRPHVRRRRLRPAARSATREAVLRDVRQGKVSAERARARDLPRRRRIGHGAGVAPTARRRTHSPVRRATRCTPEPQAEQRSRTLRLPDEPAPGRRHRRHVHRRDADRRGDRPRRDREGALDAGRPVRAGSCTRSSARSPAGEARGGAGQLRLPRDHRRDERDHRGQDRAQRLRHDRRLPRPARDRAPGAARRSTTRSSRSRRRSCRATARSASSSGSGRRARCWCRSTTTRCATRPRCCASTRRVGRRLPAALVREPGSTSSASARSSPRSCRACRSRSRPRWRPSSASTCARRRP